MKERCRMAAKGGRVKRGCKWIVQRHGSSKKRTANAEEKAIETRERRIARREIREQLRSMD
jgi:hypothetical protein